MMLTSRRTASYAPRTRGGIVISCIGFASLAASTATPEQADVISPVMGLGFVLAILITVYAPRLIRPGASWCRSVLPSATCTAVYVSAGALSLAAVVTRLMSGTHTTGLVVAAIIMVGGTFVTALPLARRAS